MTIRSILFHAAALVGASASAQLSNPPLAASIDTTQFASKADATSAKAIADAAKAAADAAKAAADAAALTAANNAAATAAVAATANAAATAAAAACQPLAGVPPVEVPGGTPGTGTSCRLANAANNRISRTGIFTVGANGAILCGGSTTCNWLDMAGNAMPLPTGFASYPMFFTPIGSSAAPSIRCKVASTANTGFTGAVCTQTVATVNVLGAVVEVLASSGTQIFALSLPATQANR